MFITIDEKNHITGVTGKKPPLVDSIKVSADDLVDYGNTDYVFKYIGKKVIKVPKVKPIDELRVNEYPSIENQLDMLWHAMDVGEIPKATIWYNTVKSVKNKYPKDK